MIGYRPTFALQRPLLVFGAGAIVLIALSPRCGSFLTAPYRLASCGWPEP